MLALFEISTVVEPLPGFACNNRLYQRWEAVSQVRWATLEECLAPETLW